MPGTDDATTYKVERSATIAAAPAVVYGLLVDFHRWPEWSPWEEIDPNMTRTYSGPESGLGATYAWQGNRKAGEGRMEIIEADEPNGLTIKLDFLKPFKAQNTTRFALAATGDGTEVTWTMVGAKTLMTKVMGLVKSMDKMIGPDFEKGLAKLKRAAEA